ncbi:MAG: extracellular solute-binding protein [Firmicutes bacterium]|nr:extracellular solute-binding protein [Bacillota bacterium]
MRNRSLSKVLCILLAVVLALGTGATFAAPKTVTLRFAIFGQQDIDYFQNKVDLAKAYQKVKPNVKIELEILKDSAEFENAMKIRKAAGELPEIMPLKPYMLANFADALAPLNNITAAKNNLFASKFAVNGNVLGIPLNSFNEFVYYKKSIFKEYNLSIPKTWDEFIETAKKIKAGGKYIPIALGAKDAWPDYPFNEFMPSLVANDGALWNKMATQDEPFTKDKPFYQAYAKIQKLFDAKVFGQDPLGIGFDQAKALFIANKAGMICAGQWLLSQYQEGGGDMKDLGAFLLPVRDNAADTLNTIAMVDGFLATPKDGKYLKEVKDFLNWFFSKSYYPGYITSTQLTSTVKGINSDVPFLKEAFSGVKVNFVVYDGGNASFQKIVDAIKFDVKRMGQEMLAGKNLDEMMNELNNKWKEARASLK